MHTIFWDWLGLRPIEDVLVLQDMLFHKEYHGERKNFLIFTEHPHCFTYSHKPIEAQLRVPEEIFRALEIPVIQATRGGEAMYHGPGQLVAYWIIDLTALNIDLLTFTSLFTHTGTRLLSQFGIYATPRIEDLELSKKGGAAGVWVYGKRKILSRGLRIERSKDRHAITKFGFAFNVSTDLAYFSYIYPCGLDIEMTSLSEELGIAISAKEIIPVLLRALTEEFMPYSIIFAKENLKPPDDNRGGIYVVLCRSVYSTLVVDCKQRSEKLHVIISANFFEFAQSFSRKSLSA